MPLPPASLLIFSLSVNPQLTPPGTLINFRKDKLRKMCAPNAYFRGVFLLNSCSGIVKTTRYTERVGTCMMIQN